MSEILVLVKSGSSMTWLWEENGEVPLPETKGQFSRVSNAFQVRDLGISSPTSLSSRRFCQEGFTVGRQKNKRKFTAKSYFQEPSSSHFSLGHKSSTNVTTPPPVPLENLLDWRGSWLPCQGCWGSEQRSEDGRLPSWTDWHPHKSGRLLYSYNFLIPYRSIQGL